MDALECIMTRRSCRAFDRRVPSREVLERVCEAATYAPTGHGKQSPLIVTVTDRTMRDRLSRMNAKVMSAQHPIPDGFDPFYGAPVVMVVLADPEVPTYFEDGCSVIANLLDAAHACGLASCWIHRAKEEFASDEGKALLREWNVDERYVGIDHVVIGYPVGELPAAAPRKKDYVRWVE